MKIVWAILLGGLAAGALDIIYAFVVYGPLSYGMTPEGVLQSVAAGWIGRQASSAGGVETAVLGLGTHFFLATIMAAMYVPFATPEEFGPRLQESFSQVRGGGGDQYPWMLAGTIFTHTVLVGLPIALVAKRFVGQQT